ncbi:hypothetical protein GWI33_018458 [Rhynchophorus ferrugineus]|uniref:Uncharacterized protein n=1 Tax=Rhynchophorus ferrugineus TaxID=354439 RepID=A0A834HW38_RHYFE|nr:hypothetical protein GWI33_018458 [Rhynchophorus ferrugineus]
MTEKKAEKERIPFYCDALFALKTYKEASSPSRTTHLAPAPLWHPFLARRHRTVPPNTPRALHNKAIRIQST